MSDNFTDNPRLLRRRAQMEDKFQKMQEQLEQELREGFRQHRQKMAQEFVENSQAPTPSNPVLDKLLRSPDGVAYGGDDFDLGDLDG